MLIIYQRATQHDDILLCIQTNNSKKHTDEVDNKGVGSLTAEIRLIFGSLHLKHKS